MNVQSIPEEKLTLGVSNQGDISNEGNGLKVPAPDIQQGV